MNAARTILTDLWNRLGGVRSLRLCAKSNDDTSGWNGTGTGKVEVTVIDDSTITFVERGAWAGDSGEQVDFGNVYRWRFGWRANSIRLERSRHDPNQPVLLLDLVPIAHDTLESVSPHLCSADVYTAVVKLKGNAIDLCWHVHGPKKDAGICCTYLHENGSSIAATEGKERSRRP